MPSTDNGNIPPASCSEIITGSTAIPVIVIADENNTNQGQDNASQAKTFSLEATEEKMSSYNNMATTKKLAMDNNSKNDMDDDSGDENDDDDSVKSTRQNHGRYNDDRDVPWNGCVCGIAHPRPTPVFWIQCEGPCQAWFNVTPTCVQLLTAELAASDPTLVWMCPTCTKMWESNPSLKSLLDMPPEILWKILEFTALPTYRVAVLEHQLALLNKGAHQLVHDDDGKMSGLWKLLLQRDYLIPSVEHHVRNKSNSNAASQASTTHNYIPAFNNTIPRRASKRRRKQTDFLSACSSSPMMASPGNNISSTNTNTGSSESRQYLRNQVRVYHLALLGRTEDAYMELERLADPVHFHGKTAASTSTGTTRNKRPKFLLNLQRLRGILQKYGPIDVNRPSPSSGRTMLQIVIAAEQSEGPLAQCVQHLLKNHGANPNVFSFQEAPLADRPAIYFAISRAMPKLVRALIEDANPKADLLNIRITGQFRLTFDTSRIVMGREWSPLDHASQLLGLEVTETETPAFVPPYWVTRMTQCRRLVQQATKQQQQQQQQQQQTT